jgi:hypothetical protein
VIWQERQFRRGDVFVGFLAAANCDPAKFEHPHTFDITRHANPHLSFGTGVQFCLGFQLVRAEAAIAFGRIRARFPDMRVATQAKIKSHKRLGIRALARLYDSCHEAHQTQKLLHSAERKARKAADLTCRMVSWSHYLKQTAQPIRLADKGGTTCRNKTEDSIAGIY